MSIPTPDAAHGDVDAFVRSSRSGQFDRVDLAAVHRRLTDLVDAPPRSPPPPPRPGPGGGCERPDAARLRRRGRPGARGHPQRDRPHHASAWRLLTDGIRLADVTSRGRTPWNPERERDWLAHAAAAHTALGLNFSVTATPTTTTASPTPACWWSGPATGTWPSPS